MATGTKKRKTRSTNQRPKTSEEKIAKYQHYVDVDYMRKRLIKFIETTKNTSVLCSTYQGIFRIDTVIDRIDEYLCGKNKEKQDARTSNESSKDSDNSSKARESEPKNITVRDPSGLSGDHHGSTSSGLHGEP